MSKEIIARRDAVMAHAKKVFENQVTARQWMTSPNEALGGNTPSEQCKTETGAKEVERILNALEWGGIV